MNDTRTEKSFSRRFWNLFIERWVADVPEDIACCEYDCQEYQCQQGRWETCQRRLQNMAVFEEYEILVPADEVGAKNAEILTGTLQSSRPVAEANVLHSAHVRALSHSYQPARAASV